MQLNSAVHPSRENRELELTREQKPHFNPESVDKPLPAPNSSSPPPAPPNTATQDTPPHAKATLMTNFLAPQHDPEGDKMANLVEQNIMANLVEQNMHHLPQQDDPVTINQIDEPEREVSISPCNQSVALFIRGGTSAQQVVLQKHDLMLIDEAQP